MWHHSVEALQDGGGERVGRASVVTAMGVVLKGCAVLRFTALSLSAPSDFASRSGRVCY
jgi:hypothetical protein